MPLVSVVIPVYNRASLVGASIASALGQQDVPGEIEVVVVDDGSTDDLEPALREFGDRVRLVRRQNGGPSAARNSGVAESRGEWLAFLDSDDLWTPLKLAKQLRRASADGAPLVYTNRLDIGDNENHGLLSANVELHEGSVFRELLMGNFITLSSVMMRASTIRELGGFDESLQGSEDWDLWLRHSARYPVALCRAPLTLYRRHGSQISRDPERMSDNHLEVLRRALEGEGGRSLPSSDVRRILARGCVDSAGFASRTNRLQAMRLLFRSLHYAPGNPRAYKEVLRCVASALRAPQEVEPRAGRELVTTAGPLAVHEDGRRAHHDARALGAGRTPPPAPAFHARASRA